MKKPANMRGMWIAMGLFLLSGCATPQQPPLVQSCQADSDCPLPYEYAIRSSCPYQARCIEGACAVVCPWDDSPPISIAVEGESEPAVEEAVASELDDRLPPADFFPLEPTGSDFVLGAILAKNDAYTRHYITYKSAGLTISGIMNIPNGDGPFPLLILNHGHIATSIYTNGRGLKREQDYLARQGYAVLHTDYRNHAQSDKDERDGLVVRLAYAQDATSAVHAVRAAKLPNVDASRVGMLGHSMGGGVTLASLVAQPELVDAAVLYAPVSGDMRRSYERWMKRDDDNDEENRGDIGEIYGEPSANPEFWDSISSESYYDRIQSAVHIFHGTADDSVPLEWSHDTERLLKEAGKDVELTVYERAPHEFATDFTTFMEATTEFFDEYLK